MRLLATLSDEVIVPSPETANAANYRHRIAARAVVFDEDGRVGLLHVTKHGYHKLAGGGVEESEDMLAALRREIQEELGCAIDEPQELGRIDEYWHTYSQYQQSHCYTARIVGQKGQPEFTPTEVKDGFTVTWADSLEHALAIMHTDAPTSYEGQIIRQRDLLFLETAYRIVADNEVAI